MQYLRRYAISFAALVIVPFPLMFVPWVGEWLTKQYGKAWELLTDVVGQHVLGTGPVPFNETGSGETLASWIQLLIAVVLAASIALGWTIRARGRQDSPRVAAVARIALRYWLGSIMIGYGVAKLTLTQFPAPGPYQLWTLVGHKSPMGLLWTFMGASSPYQVFGGALEMIGGVLLFWRRTTTAGALVLAGVLVNVVMLNFCYDVPVKLFSSELLVASLVVAAPDLRRVAVVVLGGAAPALPPREALPVRWNRARLAAKIVFAALVAYSNVHDQLEYREMLAGGNPHTGAWRVERMQRDGKDEPSAWKMVILGQTFAVARLRDDRDEPLDVQAMKLTERDPDHLALDLETIHVELARADDSEMELVHRGFHWIQEFPYNR